MWDERFRLEGHAYGVKPSMYLVEKENIIRRGQRALAAADGGGRNAVWLAERGLEVTVVDLSAEGIARALELAHSRGVRLQVYCADLLQWNAGSAVFDLVVAVYFHLPPAHRRDVHARLYESLKPGGHLLVEGFHKKQIAHSSGGPCEPDMLYDESILVGDFPGAEIIEARTDEVVLSEGRLHRGPAVLIRFHARRPFAPHLSCSRIS
jgi:2-polyprenyl-3-methyl-5-hydroxy-6-metoxy-1,4-benzoquinol methylase